MSVSVAARSARSTTAADLPGCASRTDLFTDNLLETPPPISAALTTRRRYDALEAQAKATCLDCPMVARCLYRAVVEHDVAGFVAGTTERQRQEIRAQLGVVVEPEDFDTLAGVVGGHRQIDHDEVIRLRRQNPHESLERLAQRLGCSLSTVKRHLRQERRDPAATPVRVDRPTMEEVVAAATLVLRGLQALAA